MATDSIDSGGQQKKFYPVQLLNRSNEQLKELRKKGFQLEQSLRIKIFYLNQHFETVLVPLKS